MCFRKISRERLPLVEAGTALIHMQVSILVWTNTVEITFLTEQCFQPTQHQHTTNNTVQTL